MLSVIRKHLSMSRCTHQLNIVALSFSMEQKIPVLTLDHTPQTLSADMFSSWGLANTGEAPSFWNFAVTFLTFSQI